VLSALPGAQVRFLGPEAGPVRTDNKMLTVVAEAHWEDAPEPEVLVVPGGVGTRALLDDDRMLDWVRSVHSTSRYTTSVCTGSLVLAAAGLLQLAIEYDPQPPFDSGSPEKAPPEVVELVRSVVAAMETPSS
jgi:putative intracellular protease/amidase